MNGGAQDWMQDSGRTHEQATSVESVKAPPRRALAKASLGSVYCPFGFAKVQCKTSPGDIDLLANRTVKPEVTHKT